LSDLRDTMAARHATPTLLRGYEYWDAKRHGRPMPARADIDPMEIPRLLPHVVLMDVLRDARPGWPLDFRYRLLDTLVDSHMSRRLTGICMSDLPYQQPDSQMWRNFDWVVRERQPRINRVPYVGPHRDFLTVVDLILPLSEDGAQVTMLMSVVDFVSKQP
jgi:hypothetical protein